MNSVSALQSGLQGIQRGLGGLRRDATAIAKATTAEPVQSGDLTTPLVDLSQNRTQVDASAKVVKTSDDCIGFLLDTFA